MLLIKTVGRNLCRGCFLPPLPSFPPFPFLSIRFEIPFLIPTRGPGGASGGCKRRSISVEQNLKAKILRDIYMIYILLYRVF